MFLLIESFFRPAPHPVSGFTTEYRVEESHPKGGPPAIAARVLLYAFLPIVLAISSSAQVYPLKIHTSGRYLVDQNDVPFFLNGDAPWSLIVQPDYAGASQYLTDRAGRGFNAVLVNLIEHHYADNAPADIAGNAPFSGAPFITPNEAYFAHADSVIGLANQLGIVVLLAPIYLGFECGNQGWCHEVQAAGVADMKAWGQFVGNRYKNYPNIIWVIGGDTDPSPVRAKVDSMVTALKAADVVYPYRLMTAHASGGAQVAFYFPESWLTLNNTYTWNLSEVIPLADSAYSRASTMPFIFIEGNYEGAPGITTLNVRMQAYWSFLRGAVGHVYGNNPIWYFGSSVVSGSNEDWVSALGSQGAHSMNYFNELVTSRNWYRLIPDISGAVLTSGASIGTNQAAVAYSADSSVIIGYMPTARTVTIDPAVLRGTQIHMQWYDPSSGTYVDDGILPKAVRDYTPPLSGDWVFILDAVEGIPPPPTLESPASGSIDIPANPTLQWTASNGATSYEVQIAADAGFVTTVYDRKNIAGTTNSPSHLTYSTTYYWHVSASNLSGTSDYSPAWNFTTRSAEGCCLGMRGNIDNDPLDMIDIIDLTYLVGYMFKGGPPPPCLAEADVNGLPEPIDILDLVYLVDYMFRSGSPPAGCPLRASPETRLPSTARQLSHEPATHLALHTFPSPYPGRF